MPVPVFCVCRCANDPGDQDAVYAVNLEVNGGSGECHCRCRPDQDFNDSLIIAAERD